MIQPNKTATIVAAVVLTLFAGIAPVYAAPDNTVIGSPDIAVSSPDVEFQANDVSPMTIVLTNNGDLLYGGQAAYEQEVQTAQSVTVDVLENKISTPIEVNTGTQTIGSLSDGQTATFDFEFEFGEVPPGTYQIPVEVSYDHTRTVSYGATDETQRQNSGNTVTKHLKVRVESSPEFELSNPNQDTITAGDNGEVDFVIRNTGDVVANQSTITLQTQTPGVSFGRGNSKSKSLSVYAGALQPGETRSLSAQMGAGSDVSPGTYTVAATTEYKNQNGITTQSDSLHTGVEVQRERTFELRNIQTQDFRVDEPEATIQATIVNLGPTSVQNAVVYLDDTSSVSVLSGETAVGDLRTGESAPVSFTVSIPAEREPARISLPFAVEYENDNNDVRELSTPIRQSVSINPEQDQFEVVATNTTVSPGGNAQLETTLRYTGDEPLTDANIKLFTSDPISSSDDGAYLGSVSPGEIVNATFRVSASGDALAKPYGASVEIRYEEPDGDTRFTGSLPISVAVSEGDSGALPLLPISIFSLVILGIGALVLYRRE